MKNRYLSIAVLLLTITVLAGCGVPQEDYDQVVSDLAAAEAEIARLESELAAAEESLESELEAAAAEYDGLEAEYEDLDDEMDALITECESLSSEHDDLVAFVEERTLAHERANAYHAVVIELLGPAVTGDELNAPVVRTAVGYLVEETEDDSLQQRYDAWAASTWNRDLAYQLLWHAQVRLEEIVFEGKE